jgi:hypothetical protein
MTALTAFWRNATPEPPPANVAPAPLRIARGISAFGIIAIFLALHPTDGASACWKKQVKIDDGPEGLVPSQGGTNGSNPTHTVMPLAIAVGYTLDLRSAPIDQLWDDFQENFLSTRCAPTKSPRWRMASRARRIPPEVQLKSRARLLPARPGTLPRKPPRSRSKALRPG